MEERTITCIDCGREVKIKNYQGNTEDYRCAKCRKRKEK